MGDKTFMTLRARNAVLQSRIGLYKLGMVVLLLWALLATTGWMNVQRKIDVNVRPSIPNSNLVLGHDGVDLAAAFQFAAFVIQGLNDWGEDGASDYLVNIRYFRENRLISKTIYDYYRQDAFRRLGRLRQGDINTLQGRERSDTVPKEFYFKTQSVTPYEDYYIVSLVMDSQELLNGLPVRDTRYQYYLKVGRTSEASSSRNPYNLQLIDFYNSQGPQRIADNPVGGRS
jgi:hypothetical protein